MYNNIVKYRVGSEQRCLDINVNLRPLFYTYNLACDMCNSSHFDSLLLLVIILMLLIRSGNIEKNPGPERNLL